MSAHDMYLRCVEKDNELAALRGELDQVRRERDAAREGWFALKRDKEAAEQSRDRMREALEKVLAKCGPSPKGQFRRLDKLFGELLDIAHPVLHPELYPVEARKALEGER